MRAVLVKSLTCQAQWRASWLARLSWGSTWCFKTWSPGSRTGWFLRHQLASSFPRWGSEKPHESFIREFVANSPTFYGLVKQSSNLTGVIKDLNLLCNVHNISNGSLTLYRWPRSWVSSKKRFSWGAWILTALWGEFGQGICPGKVVFWLTSPQELKNLKIGLFVLLLSPSAVKLNSTH